MIGEVTPLLGFRDKRQRLKWCINRLPTSGGKEECVLHFKTILENVAVFMEDSPLA